MAEVLGAWSDLVILIVFTCLALLLGSLWLAKKFFIAVKSRDGEGSGTQKTVTKLETLEQIREVLLNKDSILRPATIHGKDLSRCELEAWTGVNRSVLAFAVNDNSRRQRLQKIVEEMTKPILEEFKQQSITIEKPRQRLQPALFKCSLWLMEEILLGYTDCSDKVLSEENFKTIIQCWPEYDFETHSDRNTSFPEKLQAECNTARERLVELLTHLRKRKSDSCSRESHSYVDELLQVDLDEAKQRDFEEYIAQHLLGLFVCGTEALYLMMKHTLKLIGDDPVVRKRILAEMDALTGDKSSWFVSRRKSGLEFSDAVVREIFRFSAIVPRIAFYESKPKSESEKEVVDKEAEQEGRFVSVDVKSFLRNPQLWDKAETFDPNRFIVTSSDDNEKSKQPYIPFSIGSNSCPGQALAEDICLLFLVSIATEFPST